MNYIQGLIMGLAYLAPIGVQNLFVINTALTQNLKRSIITALIVIFFDISLALACFLGIGAIMERSRFIEILILLIGSILVIFIGLNLMRSKVNMETSADVDIPIKRVVTTACVVTWFNPHAIIDGTMMLGAFRATLSSGEGIKFISGVASASCVWFLGIVLIIKLFSKIINARVMRAINVVCGAVIIFYGLKLFYNFVEKALSIMNG
ncbi:MAG: LysE family transporter [Synergistaceae bacterium]|nr:LysE family transporter [Synergistaceae bacterium]